MLKPGTCFILTFPCKNRYQTHLKRKRIIITWIIIFSLCGLAFWLWTPDIDRASLERSYLESPDDMLTLLGTQLHVRDRGNPSADVVIMLHGFGSSIYTWRGWTPVLLQQFRVIQLDLPGSGLSAQDANNDYTDDRMLDLLIALMDELNIAKASIIGHSIGGRMAWRFAAVHPERVSRLVLVAPDGFASPGFEYHIAPKVPKVFELIRFTLPKTVFRMNLKPAYSDQAVITEETVTTYHDLLRAPGNREALLDRMRQTILTEPEPFLKKITAPVLLVWGEDDAMIPVSNAEDYMRNIADVSIARIPGVGHVPQEENAEQSVVPVIDFLSK